jgi:hypothetical protein
MTVLVTMAIVLLSVAGQAAASNDFIYALRQVNNGPNKIYGFRIDHTTGALTLLQGFPMDSGGTGNFASHSEHVKYFNGRLYVINQGSDTLSAFTVNLGSGALTPMPFSPISLGDNNGVCVTVHPSGSPVIVANGSGSVSSFVVTPTTATAAPGSPYSTGGVRPFSCAFSNTGSFAYVGANLGIAAFSVSIASGILTPLAGSPFEPDGIPLGLATDSSGRLFAAEAFDDQVKVYTTSGGVPTAVSGNPFPAGGLAWATAGVLHQSGFYMVADRPAGIDEPGSVGVYRISGSGAGTTLTNVSGSPFLTGGNFTQGLALTNSGRFLVTANGGTRNLSVFQVNASTGSLTSVGVQPVNTLGVSGKVTGVAFASNASNPGDFDGDGKSDVTVYRPSTGQWIILKSGVNFTIHQTRSWGVSGDIDVPRDYDGDGRIDPAVFRPSTQNWYFTMSSSNFAMIASWGLSTDVPVPGDYNGDGRADLAVWRPSNGTWYVNTLSAFPVWGLSTDTPVPADYDGDGKVDPAVFRPSTGEWYMLHSSTNFTTYTLVSWGLGTDIPVPADYDGDGKADPAVYRPSTKQWYMKKSSTNYTTHTLVSWGLVGDIPVPADYDGDRKADPAVFRPSTNGWFIKRSSNNTTQSFSWGLSGDRPINRRP